MRLFEAICRDEEKFRHEIMKYSEGTTPKEIPPLVPSHLTTLHPTAKNKMYNAFITFKNFGGEWSEPTLAPNDKNEAEKKTKVLAVKLLSLVKWNEYQFQERKRARTGNLMVVM